MRSCLVPIALFSVTLIPAARPTLLGAPAFHPAKYREGALPELPTADGCRRWRSHARAGRHEHRLELKRQGVAYDTSLYGSVDCRGKVLAVRSGRGREREPEPAPGEPRSRPVDSTVLLALVIRAPSLLGPTSGRYAAGHRVGNPTRRRFPFQRRCRSSAARPRRRALS